MEEKSAGERESVQEMPEFEEMKEREEGVFNNLSRKATMSVISSTITSSLLLPFGYLKTQIQVMCEGRRSVSVNLISLASKIHKESTLRAFYIGLDAAVLASLASTGTSAALYLYLKNREQQRSDSHQTKFYQDLKCMIISRSVGSIMSTPFELVLTRMQIDHQLPKHKRRNYTDVFSAIKRINTEEGIYGCWRGGTSLFYLKMCGSSSHFFFYTLCQFGFGFERTLSSTAINGGIAAFLTCSLVIPLDNVRIKQQYMVKNEEGEYPYKGLRDCFKKTLEREGFKGFYAGYSAYLLKTMPHGALNYAIIWIISGGTK